MVPTAVFLMMSTTLWHVVYGYGTGAPHGACNDLEPQHYGVVPKDPKIFPNPYSLETLHGNNQFTPGHEIQIRLTGNKFRGFIFQVRDDLGRSRGRFTLLPPNIRAITCRHPDDTITHVSPEVKTEVTFTWRAPENARHQLLYLSGTVVESEQTFWSDKVLVLYNSFFARKYDDLEDKIDL